MKNNYFLPAFEPFESTSQNFSAKTFVREEIEVRDL